MPITKRADRQSINMAWVDINLADIVSGVAQNAIVLPVGAVVTSGQTVTTEAWNSTTSDVMTVGDSGSANRYMASTTIRALAVRNALVPTGFISVGNDVTITWTSGGGVPTTGKVRLEVHYFIRGRAKTTQD